MENTENRLPVKDALKKAASRLPRIRVSRRVGIGLAASLFFLFALYAAAGFWVLPSWIKSKAQTIAAEKLNRRLVISSLDFNPFTFALDVKGLKLTEPESDESFVSFERLTVNLSVWSVLKLTPVVTDLTLEKPFVRVIRFSDSSRNFDDIAALFRSPEGDAAETDAQKAEEAQKAAEVERAPRNAEERRAMIRKRKFGIYNFRMVDARIELENRELGTKTVVSDFNVGLPYLYRGPIRGIERHVELQFEALINGKKLEITREEPVEGSRDRLLKLDMDNIDLKRIFNYVPFHPAYKFNEGWLDVHLTFYIHRPRDAATSMDIGGSVTVRDVHMTQHGKPLFDLHKLHLELGVNSPSKRAYSIEKLEIIRPEVHAIVSKHGVLNLANLLARASEEVAPVEDETPQKGGVGKVSASAGKEGAVVPAVETKVAAAEPEGMTFAMKSFAVKHGRFRFADHSDAVPMHASASGFNLEISDVALDSSKREISVGRIHSPATVLDVDFAKQRAAAAPKAVEQKPEGKAADKDEKPYTIRLSALEIAGWQAKLKNSNTGEMAALPLSASVAKFGARVSDVELNLENRVLSVGDVQSSGGTFDVVMAQAAKAPAAAKKDKTATATPGFTVRLGKLGLSNWGGRYREAGGDPASPLSAVLSRAGLTVENLALDLNAQTVSVGAVRSSGGNFDVQMENAPPKVPVAAAAGADETAYRIRVDRVDIAGWSGKVVNSDRRDRFQMPFTATLSKMGVTVEKADVSLKEQSVSIGSVSTKGGHAEVLLADWKKPLDTGRRAVERAQLMASIIAAKKALPPSGFSVSVGKLAVSDWSARVKNSNTTNRSGLPVSGRANNIDLVVANLKADLKKRDISIGELSSKGVVLMGQTEKHEKFVPKNAASGKKPVVMPEEAPYTFQLGKLAISGWSLKGRNLNMKNPLGATVTDIAISGQDISSTPGNTSRFSLKATVDKTGKFEADGRLGFSPLDVNLALDMKEMSVVAIQPYIEDYVNLTLKRANLSLQGNLLVKENAKGGIEGGYRGDITVSRLQTVDQINQDAFVRWRNLALRDVDAKFLPFSVKVREAEIDNFFARVILNADGRLNLRNIMRSDAGGATSLTETEDELDELAEGDRPREGGAKTTKGGVTTGTVKPDADGHPDNIPLVLVDKLIMRKGRVRFTDNFIKPHYTADISEMEGTIAGLSSDPNASAKLDFHGQVNRAPLTVAGTISPLKEHLALDVKAHVRGMELAQFSSYTAKYIGYGIEKGKLSFDVEYKLEDGVLVAQNRLILDQLTFGEQTPGEPVTSLPVELAVSLLKDGNGVIDINLPIGGSLDDPEFSIGGILAKVFLSSLKRVILSPFAFLSIKFAGGAELSYLEFDAGSSSIPEKETPKLEALAKAFTERPELKLDVTGLYDPVADRAGLAKTAISRKVRSLKRRDLQEQGQTVMMSQLTVSDAEYPALLERVYKDEDFKKPRNFIGMQKKLATAEMEKLIVDNYEATEEEFLALAYQRSENVKHWLVEKGKISDSRVFLLASKAGEAGEKGESAARVDFAVQ